MKTIKITALLILLAASPAALFGQGGSNYSVFGIGDIFKSAGAVYEGMGGGAAGVPSRHGINLKNPAMWSLVDKTRLQAGYNFNQRLINSENSNLLQNNGQVNSILGLFAIDTALGLSAGFGFHPYSSVNYMISTPIYMVIDGVNIEGKNSYTGSGGISAAYLGGSIKIMDDLYAGASVFALFGTIKTTIFTEFFAENYYVSASFKSDYFSGIGYRGGLYYQAGENWGLGAYLETAPNLDVESDVRYQSVLTEDTIITFDEEHSLPPAFGIGANYRSGKFIFATDIAMQDFSGFKYNIGANTEFRNNVAFILGIQRMGSDRYTAPLLDKAAYNFGLGYRQLYYSYKGTGIDEIWISAGMEIPVVSNMMINWSAAFGTRGTTDFGLVREYFGKLTVDISIGETWFTPFRR